MSRLKKVSFKPISPPDFSGEPEQISAKVPSSLKQLLTDHGRENGRTLTEVVDYILTQYGIQIRDATASEAAEDDSNQTPP